MHEGAESTTRPEMKPWQTRLVMVRAGARFVGTVIRQRAAPTQRAARRTRAAFYRDLWLAGAAELGFPAQTMPDGAVEITTGTTMMIVDKTPRGLESPQVVRRATDKAATYAMLADAGIPVPRHTTFSLSSLGVARDFLEQAPGPCVVKPARHTSGGSGVTTGVVGAESLLDAASTAAAVAVRMGRFARGRHPARRVWDRFAALRDVPLLIEHQVPGSNYRLLYLDGRLIDAIRRSAPEVVGDGRSTVGELVRRLNVQRARKGRRLGISVVSDDADLRATLAAHGHTLGSVPAAGAVVQLKTAINEGAFEDNRPARGELCPEILAQGAQAATTVRARLAGVDVITADPRVPLDASGGCVLEVNVDPGLAMHCHGHPGQIQPAVALLADLTGVDAERVRVPHPEDATRTPDRRAAGGNGLRT